RKETEARISDTRENLERLQDVRDEVDKQIRHLQRQAATARRYQALKETERRLTAELLALRLREIDSGAEVQDSAVRECELRMQQALADQRSAEAAIETQRVYQNEQSERVSAVQGRYYEVGAEISRNEHAQARATLTELESHIQRDERQIASLRAEIGQLAPELVQAQSAEAALNEGATVTEAELAAWQQRWEDFNREQGAAHQTTQVERARIEQLENQLRRLAAQSDRLAIEREALMAQESSALLAQLTDKESVARSTADELSQALTVALDRSQKLRAAQFEAEGRLESARTEREKRRAEVVSLEALQKAALQRGDSRTAEWLSGTGLAQKPRLAAQLSVRS